MKKFIFAAVMMMAVSLGASAQTTTGNNDKKQDMKDLRKDIRDVRRDRKARREELKEGDKTSAKALTQDIRRDKKDIRSDAKDLREDGIKHPVKRADRQIHRARVKVKAQA